MNGFVRKERVSEAEGLKEGVPGSAFSSACDI